jgi:hypothetical protein
MRDVLRAVMVAYQPGPEPTVTLWLAPNPVLPTYTVEPLP